MSDKDNAEIFQRLRTIGEDVAAIKAMMKNAKEAQDDHEDRLRSLERWQWKVVGIATAVSAAASVAVAVWLK
jgi:ribosomal 50S subunit-associated protein YjgA (DUF615 family)